MYMLSRSLVDNVKMEMQWSSLDFHFHILVWPFNDHFKIKMEMAKQQKFEQQNTPFCQ